MENILDKVAHGKGWNKYNIKRGNFPRFKKSKETGKFYKSEYKKLKAS